MKLSVILPVYNVEKYLDKSMTSLTNQIVDDVEIILVDDGSTDSSLERMREWELLDNRITVVSKVNEGSGFARNYGLGISKGEYVYFMDPDDWIEDGFFEKILSIISHKEVQFIGFGHNIYKGDRLIKTVKSNDTFEINEIEMNTSSFNKIFNSISLFEVWNKVYNRKFLIDNQLEFTNMKNGQDAYFNIEVAKKINHILILKDTFYNYYASREGSSQNSYYSYDRFENSIKIALNYESLYKKYSSSESEPNVYWINTFYTSIRQNIKENENFLWRKDLFDEKIVKMSIQDVKYIKSKIKLIILKYFPKRYLKYI